jgi:hypothetical protein
VRLKRLPVRLVRRRVRDEEVDGSGHDGGGYQAMTAPGQPMRSRAPPARTVVRQGMSLLAPVPAGW